MTDRKPRPLWPLLTAALIGLPVLYVLGFGPAARIEELELELVDSRWFVIYDPLVWVIHNGPEWCVLPLRFYLVLWGVER
jgi:hypothetical protein